MFVSLDTPLPPSCPLCSKEGTGAMGDDGIFFGVGQKHQLLFVQGYSLPPSHPSPLPTRPASHNRGRKCQTLAFPDFLPTRARILREINQALQEKVSPPSAEMDAREASSVFNGYNCVCKRCLSGCSHTTHKKIERQEMGATQVTRDREPLN